MLKVAAAQTFVSADIAENGRAIRKLISSAAAQGVRLINFCEGALSGYGKFQIMAQDDWQTYDWAAQMPSCVPSLSFAGNFAFSRLSAEHIGSRMVILATTVFMSSPKEAL
ncbi:nitrilase/cyanide hydratase domain-containing protein [Rhizobium phaseoli]|nr:nitrilase/cyanide hydratase domain-containing protein [Rhizobium phaseoli]